MSFIAHTMHNECWLCIHKKDKPGHAHIECTKPDKAMVGHPHGIEKGWFSYPVNYDPVWKMRPCNNYEKAK